MKLFNLIQWTTNKAVMGKWTINTNPTSDRHIIVLTVGAILILLIGILITLIIIASTWRKHV